MKRPSQIAGRFFVICRKKIAILMPFGLHFARFQSHLNELIFFDFKTILRKLNCSVLSVGIKVQNTLKMLRF